MFMQPGFLLSLMEEKDEHVLYIEGLNNCAEG